MNVFWKLLEPLFILGGIPLVNYFSMAQNALPKMSNLFPCSVQCFKQHDVISGVHGLKKLYLGNNSICALYT
jgi:hypothetical protein